MGMGSLWRFTTKILTSIWRRSSVKAHKIIPVERIGYYSYCENCGKEITRVYIKRRDGKYVVFWKHGYPGKY